MANKLLTEDMQRFLLNKEFVSVGTCDFNAQPNAAPKFVIKVDDEHVYLADYVIGKTFENLQINNKASLSVIDIKKLEGYQINGAVKIITKGREYKNLLKVMAKQAAYHSARRIIEEIDGVGKYENYEVMLPEKVVILKIKCEAFTKIDSMGKLTKRKR